MKKIISTLVIASTIVLPVFGQEYFQFEKRENSLENKYESTYKQHDHIQNYQLASIVDFTHDSSDLISEYIDYLLERFEDKNKIILPYEIVIYEDILETYLKAVDLINIQIKSTQDKKRQLALQVLKVETFRPLYESINFNKQIRRITNDFINSPKSQIKNMRTTQDEVINKNFISALEESILNNISNEKNENLYDDFLVTSKIYKNVSSGESIKGLAKKKIFWKKFSDKSSGVLTSITSSLSRGFGALVGNIAWRDGHLKDNQKLRQELYSELKPFDILLEKKKYKLTDYTIPGYWGHAGVYVGTKEQLISEGLWENKELKPFHKIIESGKTIFQVRRSGLVWNSIEEFIDLDEMGIIRIKNFNKEKINKEVLLEKLMEQAGKSYDYSFNTYTTSKITCTEIVAFSYGRINWPTESLLGRKTFTPNHLTSLLFYKDSPIELIKYVGSSKDGKRLDLNLQDLGKTVNYVQNENVAGSYLLKGEKCKRELVSRRRGERKYRYSCVDTYTETSYSRE